MGRYLSIWQAQLRYSFVREMMFKGNFLLWIVVELCWFALQLTFVQVLYLKVDEIAGWTKWEMVLLVTTSHLVQQFFQCFLMANCMQIPELVRSGRLDFFLAQPAHPQFLVSTRLFEPGALINAAFAAGLCAYAFHRLEIPWSPANTALFAFLIVLGVVIHYSLMLSFMTLAFWMTRAQGFMTGYYQIFQIARLPREAFTGFTRIFFTWVIPMLLVANVPAQTLAKGPQAGQILALLALAAAALSASSAFFRFGLSRYTSASS
jgi:ABC-2 type transport system permease protein